MTLKTHCDEEQYSLASYLSENSVITINHDVSYRISIKLLFKLRKLSSIPSLLGGVFFLIINEYRILSNGFSTSVDMIIYFMPVV
jgi:hypothetical protein